MATGVHVRRRRSHVGFKRGRSSRAGNCSDADATMSEVTRRAVLQGVAGATVLLAGCNDLVDPTDDAASPTRGEDGDRVDGSATNPDTLVVRVAVDQPPVWLADESGNGRPTTRDGGYYGDSLVVDSPSRADRVSVADGIERDRVDSFFDATDFDAETIYVQTVRVEECFRLDLCRISWVPGKVSTDYVRRLRPYTDHCGVDTYVFETHLIRIPDSLDADQVTSHSSSIGTGRCRNQERTAADGGDETPTETDGRAD